MKVENSMIIVLALALLLFAIVFTIAILYPNGLPNNTKTISVSGSGYVYAYPNMVSINFYINGTGNTSQIAAANLSLTLAKLNSSLSNYIIGNNGLSSEYYSNNKINKTYVTSEMLNLTLDNTSNINNIINSAVSIPNVYVESVNTAFSQKLKEKLVNESIARAYQNASIQANAIFGSNTTLTATNITIENYGIVPIYGVSPLGFAVSSSNAQIKNQQYYIGNSKVTSTVSVIFKES